MSVTVWRWSAGSYPPVTNTAVEPVCASPAHNGRTAPIVTNQAGSNDVTGQTDGPPDPELVELGAAVVPLDAEVSGFAARVAAERSIRRLQGDGR